jgi:hypothetical protein
MCEYARVVLESPGLICVCVDRLEIPGEGLKETHQDKRLNACI